MIFLCFLQGNIMRAIVGTRGEIGESVYREMLELRHKIFHGRLQWDIPSASEDPNLEEDMFDTDGTVYVVIGDPVVACCRMVPTTGTTMISVLWPDVMNCWLGCMCLRSRHWLCWRKVDQVQLCGFEYGLRCVVRKKFFSDVLEMIFDGAFRYFEYPCYLPGSFARRDETEHALDCLPVGCAGRRVYRRTKGWTYEKYIFNTVCMQSAQKKTTHSKECAVWCYGCR